MGWVASEGAGGKAVRKGAQNCPHNRETAATAPAEPAEAPQKASPILLSLRVHSWAIQSAESIFNKYYFSRNDPSPAPGN